MRDEIEQRIKNSGMSSEGEIKENYKNALKKRGRSERDIEELIQNETQIQKILHTVKLGSLNIQDDEIEEITQMIVNEKPQTRQITLCDNSITDKGAIKMGALLVKLNHLSVLDVQGNKIGPKGVFALLKLAAQKPGFNLALHGNNISDVVVIEELKEKAKQIVQKKMNP